MLAIAPDQLAEFAALCARERAPWAAARHRDARRPARLGDRARWSAAGRRPARAVPRQAAAHDPSRRAAARRRARRSISAGASIAEALDRVLGLPTVADKSFLVTIGDRTVGGLVVARSDGRPLPGAGRRLRADHRRLRHLRRRGDGDRRAPAGRAARRRCRLARSRSREAITNLAGAPIGELSRIKLSCNWMAAAGHPGEDARLYAGVRAASETASALGIAIPVGKDSMSMRTQWDGKAVVSPVTLVVTAFGPVHRRSPRASRPSCAAAAPAVARRSRRRPGPARRQRLAQVFGQLGDTPPDLDDPTRLRRVLRRDADARRGSARSPRITTAPTAARSSRARDGVRVGLRPRARRLDGRRRSVRARCSPRSSARSSRSRAADVAARARARSPASSVSRDRPRGPGDRIDDRASRRRSCSTRRASSCARAGRTSRTRSRAAATTPRAPTRSTPRASTPANPGLTAAADVRPGGRHRRAVHREGRAPARRDPARAGRQRPDRDGGRVHARRLRGGRRPHDGPDRRPHRPQPTCAARSRAAASRSATCSAPAAAGPRRSATTRARATRSAGSSIAPTRSCSACATAARWSPTSRRISSRTRERGRGSSATAASGSRRASSCCASKTARRCSSAAWPARASRSRTRTAKAAPSSRADAARRARGAAPGRGALRRRPRRRHRALPGEPERLAERHRLGHHARRPRHRDHAAPRARVPHGPAVVASARVGRRQPVDADVPQRARLGRLGQLAGQRAACRHHRVAAADAAVHFDAQVLAGPGTRRLVVEREARLAPVVCTSGISLDGAAVVARRRSRAARRECQRTHEARRAGHRVDLARDLDDAAAQRDRSWRSCQPRGGRHVRESRRRGPPGRRRPGLLCVSSHWHECASAGESASCCPAAGVARRTPARAAPTIAPTVIMSGSGLSESKNALVVREVRQVLGLLVRVASALRTDLVHRIGRGAALVARDAEARAPE